MEKGVAPFSPLISLGSDLLRPLTSQDLCKIGLKTWKCYKLIGLNIQNFYLKVPPHSVIEACIDIILINSLTIPAVFYLAQRSWRAKGNDGSLDHPDHFLRTESDYTYCSRA